MKVEIYDPAKLVSANATNTLWKAKNVSALSLLCGVDKASRLYVLETE
jgi:hypothetical protein